ncbi:PP2C family serine/threonine-protein phosphatase [Rheinheimera texasensis]|uniref:PP2C family serine/threonine-protein phosphatase n=1 Tax=Rheinheimera texasensis TaxID=306205 RepID=UPI000A00858E|nr:PP2C family serine/threonine-protein phosphatase [Rheinheimera texasensis]
MKPRFYQCSVIGPAHIRDLLPNQDYLLAKCWERRWVAVVCDGMGSRSHSDIGSREAAKAAIYSVQNNDFNSDDKTIVQALYLNWLARLKTLNVEPKDAVTTCILVWGTADGRFRYAHLGDGMIASPKSLLSNANTTGFSNETTGLGLSRHLSDWRLGSGYIQDHGNRLLLMTDGISEDLLDPTAFSQYVTDVLLKKSRRQGKCWLKRQLNNWPTPGHSDDKTLIAVCLPQGFINE